MKTAYCFDLDGTITTAEILPFIASELGITDEMSTLTRLTMDGHIPFADSMRLRCLILSQVPIEQAHIIIQSVPLDAALVNFIRARLDRCFIITGNLDAWVQPLIKQIGCEGFCSTTTGATGSLRLKNAIDKAETVQLLRARGKFERIIAIGDGANDAPMLAAADIGIAYGGVHVAAPATVAASKYVVNSSESLCGLLNTLESPSAESSIELINHNQAAPSVRGMEPNLA